MKCLVVDDLKIEINDDIFRFLYPDNNVKLSEMSDSDKVYMMYLLKQYYLGLRNKLGLDQSLTFGLEIEFEEANLKAIQRQLYNSFYLKEWEVVPDWTLVNGAEINSPKLRDSEDTWIDLSGVCNLVSRNAYVMNNTGGHIHIGTQILGNNPKYWGNFIKLWTVYENVIFRFLYGEYLSARSGIIEHAKPISLDFIDRVEDIDKRTRMINANHLFKLLDVGEDNVKLRRKKSVNFTNVSRLEPYKYDQEINMNTIEFRSPNGTFDPVIWQNNVNFLVKLMLYCRSDSFNEEIINRRRIQIINDEIPSNISKYSRIYIDQAIELCDMIFDNNLDKVYFLRQYVKSGEVSSRPLVKSRKFTRV